MPHELRRLLNTHEFLQQALRDYKSVMSKEHLEGLRRDQDRVFGQLVNYVSIHPQVTLAQLNFLLCGLAEMAANKKQAETLRQTCLATAERLAGSGNASPGSHPAGQSSRSVGTLSEPTPLPGGVPLTGRETWLLDRISDRAAICDRQYRYLFSNRANAAFHHKPPAEMVGKPVATIVGKRRFEEITAPAMEKCFAGQSISFPVSYISGNRTMTYSISCEPMRDDAGDVVAAICISRDISNYAIRSTVLYEVPS